jgi:hypothetical protein
MPGMTVLLLSKNFRALSLFRIAFASYLVGEFLTLDFPYMSAFYGGNGILPSALLIEGERIDPAAAGLLPVFALLEQESSLVVISGIYLVALAGLLIGYKTTASAITVFGLKSYLIARNPLVSFGADLLSRVLLLWSLFLPLNRYWSIDATADSRPPDRPWPSLPFMAVRLQVAYLYLFSVLYKLQGEPWRHGSAIGWALSDNVYGQTATAQALLESLAGLLPFATFAVLALQLTFPLLVLSPWCNDATRALALTGVATMHASFVFCLNLGGFPFVCLAMLILLVPDTWLRWLPDRRHVGPEPPSPHGLGPRPKPELPAPAVAACGILAVLALLSNVSGMAERWTGEWHLLDRIVSDVQVGQRWNLFAPVPTHFRRTYRIDAVLADGSAADALSLIRPTLLEGTQDGHLVRFANARWRKYFTTYQGRTENEWTALATYLCRRLKDARPALSSEVRSIAFSIVREPAPNTVPLEPRETVQWTRPCT